MNKSFSIYLDLCRVAAAAAVVIAHLITFGIAKGEWTAFIPELGRDAVIVFFVLSGYVIAYTTQRKHPDMADYLIARMTRIYSVALPILAIALVCDLIAMNFNPEAYPGRYQFEKLYIYLPLHLAFMGEIWILSEQPFSLPPYWSLGYEVWYYILFGALFFYRGAKRIAVFGAIFLFVGYKLWILFPIWLAGVGLLKLCRRETVPQWVARAAFWLPVPLYIAFRASGLNETLIALSASAWPFPGLALGSAGKYLSDYVVCGLFLAHLFGAHFMNLKYLDRAGGPIVKLASYTFTLYLLHAPIMITAQRNLGLDPESPATSVGVITVVVVLTYVVGSVTEKRRHLLTPVATWLVRRASCLARKLRLAPLFSPNAPARDSAEIPPLMRDVTLPRSS